MSDTALRELAAKPDVAITPESFCSLKPQWDETTLRSAFTLSRGDIPNFDAAKYGLDEASMVTPENSSDSQPVTKKAKFILKIKPSNAAERSVQSEMTIGKRKMDDKQVQRKKKKKDVIE